MMTEMQCYNKILVAVDFSHDAYAAVNQAIWLARKVGASITLAHVLPNLRALVESASYQAKVDFLYGEGSEFRREIQQESEAKLRQLISDLNATDLNVKFEILLGAPYLQITHAVQQEGYDLVLAGTRGLAGWKQFFVGSTSQGLIRNCPATVWIVKKEHQAPPKAVLAATDFSDASREAVLEGMWIAQQASAEFHLLHVIDSMDVPEEVLTRSKSGVSLRHEVNEESKRRFDSFIDSLNADPNQIQRHLSSGPSWQEVGRLAKHLNIDLIAMGTVGRSGISGAFIGNTAERVLATCDCSILAVKPADFVSPIMPSISPLRPIQNDGTTPK